MREAKIAYRLNDQSGKNLRILSPPQPLRCQVENGKVLRLLEGAHLKEVSENLTCLERVDRKKHKQMTRLLTMRNGISHIPTHPKTIKQPILIIMRVKVLVQVVVIVRVLHGRH